MTTEGNSDPEIRFGKDAEIYSDTQPSSTALEGELFIDIISHPTQGKRIPKFSSALSTISTEELRKEMTSQAGDLANQAMQIA